MIKSMTAFARSHNQGDWGGATVEIKTVNSRYLENNLRLPDALRELEMPLRELFRQHLQRGKVDCFIRYTAGSSVATTVAVNHELVQQLHHAAQQVQQQAPEATAYDLFDILRWPGVVQMDEQDLVQAQKNILGLATEALEKLNDVRSREGEALKEFLLEKLNTLAIDVKTIKAQSHNNIEVQRQKLREKLAQLTLELPVERIEQEIVLLVQRSDINEELERLSTHITETERLLKKGGAIGRQLDFLMQEFNRETNTIASKALDMTITKTAVNMKVLIEQMREQIQNIE